MIRAGVVLLATTVVASLAPTSAGHAEDSVTLRSADALPADSPSVQAVDHIDHAIRERTGGRLRIESLGPKNQDSEIFNVSQVRNGTLEMARVNLAVLDALVPSTAVLSLPYLFQSRAHLERVLDGPIGQVLLGRLERVNLIGLCFYEQGAQSIYGRLPVRSVADMRGLAVQVPVSTVAAATVRALGAIPVPLPHYLVKSALQTGAIDESTNALSAYFLERHYLDAHYYTLTAHSRVPGVLIFSKTVWDRLSPADRRVLRVAAKESVSFQRQMLEAYEATTRQTAEAAGVQFVDVDRPSFAKALRPQWRELLPAPDGDGLIGRVLSDPEVAASPNSAGDTSN